MKAKRQSADVGSISRKQNIKGGNPINCGINIDSPAAIVQHKLPLQKQTDFDASWFAFTLDGSHRSTDMNYIKRQHRQIVRRCSCR